MCHNFQNSNIVRDPLTFFSRRPSDLFLKMIELRPFHAARISRVLISKCNMIRYGFNLYSLFLVENDLVKAQLTFDLTGKIYLWSSCPICFLLVFGTLLTDVGVWEVQSSLNDNVVLRLIKFHDNFINDINHYHDNITNDDSDISSIASASSLSFSDDEED